MTDAEADPAFRVEPGPVDLPIVGWYPAIVGIGRVVTLFLEPTVDLRQPRFELELGIPFQVGTDVIERPSDVGSFSDRLVNQGIQAASTTASHGISIELTAGELLMATSWNLTASDGRHWSAQPSGGIARWTATSTRRIAEHPEAGPNVTARSAERRWEAPREEDAIVDIGSGLDLPGGGWRLVEIEIEETGRFSLALQPGPKTVVGDSEKEGDLRRGFEFFADLRADPAAVPPDPEVLASMSGAIEALDRSARELAFVALDDVVPPVAVLGPTLIARLGSPVGVLRAAPGGRLIVAWPDGFELSSATTWWVSGHQETNWAGAAGVVTRTDHPRAMYLPPDGLRDLAEAWLDHDRTGRDSRFWAWARATDVVRDQPAGGWILVRFLVDGAADDGQLMSVAAGPLEDFLGAHGPAIIDELEVAAGADPKLLKALSGVWKNWIDDEVWGRIQRLVGRSGD
jgi:uncharacterized protein DUF6869